MEFATAATGARGAGAGAGAGAGVGAGPHRQAEVEAQAKRADAAAAQAEAEAVEMERIRACYQQAIQAHAAGTLAEAGALYDRVLSHALLAPAPLRAAAAAALPSHADAVDASIAAGVLARMQLRFLTLKNMARLTQQRAEAQAPAEAQQQDAPVEVPSAPAEHANAMLRRALQLDLDALDTRVTLTRMQQRQERERARAESAAMGAGTGMGEHKSASADVASATVPLMEDVPVWMHAARTAMQLGQLALVRRMCESVLQLRPDYWPAVDLLLDALLLLADYPSLHTLLQHALSLDPWHVKSMLLQRRVAKQLGSSPNSSPRADAFLQLEERLQQVDQRDVQAAEQKIGALVQMASQHMQEDADAGAEVQVLVRRWDCSQFPPSFARLVQELVLLYSELTDITPVDALHTTTCTAVGMQLKPLAAAAAPSLSLPIAMHVLEAPASAAKPNNQDGVRADSSEQENVEMKDADAPLGAGGAGDASAAAVSALAPSSSSPRRHEFSLQPDAPADGTVTFLDPVRESPEHVAAAAAAALSTSSLLPRSHALQQQKQQQRSCVLDFLRLGWTSMEDMRVAGVHVDPVCFNIVASDAERKEASAGSHAAAAAETASSPVAGVAALPCPSYAVDDERLQVIDFLRQHAFASRTPPAEGSALMLGACTELATVALSFLRHLYSHAEIRVDHTSMLSLLQMVLDSGVPDDSDDAALEFWLYGAELALESHRTMHPTQLSEAARRVVVADALTPEVIDLCRSPSPPPLAQQPAPPSFKQTRRWRARHPAALDVMHRFVGLILLHAASTAETARAGREQPPLFGSSVELQLRWSWLLAQRSLHPTPEGAERRSQPSHSEQVTTACHHLQRCIDLFKANPALASVNLPHLQAQGPLTVARLEQALASLHVSQLIHKATHAHARGDHGVVLHTLRSLMWEAVAPPSPNTTASELQRLPPSERDTVLQLFHGSADALRDSLSLLLHALLSFRFLGAHALTQLHGKVPISTGDKQRCYNGAERVWNALKKMGQERIVDALVEGHVTERRMEYVAVEPYSLQQLATPSLFRQLQSDIGVSLALAMRGSLNSTAKETMCQILRLGMSVGLALSQAQQRSLSDPLHPRILDLRVQRHELLFVQSIHRVMAAHDMCGENCGRVFLRTFLNRMYDSSRSNNGDTSASSRSGGTLLKLMGECQQGADGAIHLRAGPPLEGVTFKDVSAIPFDTYERTSALAVTSANALLAPPFFATPVQPASDAAHGGKGEFASLLQTCRDLLTSETGQCLSCLHGVLKTAHAGHANTPQELAMPGGAVRKEEQVLRERVLSFLLVHYRSQLRSIHSNLLRWHARKREQQASEKHKRRKAASDGDVAGALECDASSATSSAPDEPEQDWYDVLRVDVWSVLDVLEQPLAALQLIPERTAFIDAVLAAPPSARMEECMRAALTQAALPPDDDDWSERLYHFYLGIVLPAFLQRTEDPAHATGRVSKDMHTMQSSLQRILRFSLLSDPRSVVCWGGMALAHWHLATEELYGNGQYADLSLMRREHAEASTAASSLRFGTPLHAAPLALSKIASCRQSISVWLDNFFRFFRCAMLTLHVLHTEHGVGSSRAAEAGSPSATASYTAPCCSAPLTFTPIAVESTGVDPSPRIHALVFVELLEKVASAVAVLHEISLTLLADERQRADSPHSPGEAAASPAAAAPTAGATLVQFLRRPEIDGLSFSYRCWKIAAMMQPQNGLTKLLQAKAARKLNAAPFEHLSLLGASLDLSQPHPFPIPTLRMSRKRGFDEVSSSSPSQHDGDEKGSHAAATDQEADGGVVLSAVGLRALCSLHAARLHHIRAAVQLHKEEVRQHVASRRRSAAATIQPTRALSVEELAAPNLSCEASFQLIESYSFSRWIQSGQVQHVDADSPALRDDYLQRVTRIEADVVAAMRYCVRVQHNFFQALVCLADLSQRENPDSSDASGSSEAHQRAGSLQPFVIGELRRLINAFPKTRNLASFPGVQSVNEHAPPMGLTPLKAAWWQASPWSGVSGYFRCLRAYLQLLVRTFNFGAVVDLINMGRSNDSLADFTRLSLYCSAVTQLLSDELSSPVPHLHASDAEVFFKSACRACLQMFEQGVPMRDMLVRCYTLAMRMEGRTEISTLDSDQALEADRSASPLAVAPGSATAAAASYSTRFRVHTLAVHTWLSTQRWARSIGRYSDLLGVGGSGGTGRRAQRRFHKSGRLLTDTSDVAAPMEEEEGELDEEIPAAAAAEATPMRPVPPTLPPFSPHLHTVSKSPASTAPPGATAEAQPPSVPAAAAATDVIDLTE